MQEQLLYLREEHGDVFATKLPTGQIVPWRPLNIGEFIRYQDAFEMGNHPSAYLENEVFKQCVLDTALVQGINQLKAGIVSTVVATIMSHSGPQSVEDLNQVLEFSRASATKVIHDLVSFVCQAFPAYKPEELYAMDYTTLMLRLAMAERKMLQTGLIAEPLNFELPGTAEEQSDQHAAQEQKRRKDNSEMMDRYHEQQGIKVSDSIKQARQETRERIIDHPVAPPLSIASKKRTIITGADIAEHQSVLSGHERDIVHQHKVVRDTAHVYENYIKDLDEGKELKILTDEERLAVAMKRMERNRLANIERANIVKEAQKAELPKLLEAREEARRRKEKKARRRRR